MIADAKNLESNEIKLTDRAKYTKKELVADHPTWCPGCGDFSILSIYFKMMEKLQVPHEKITSIAGIGCSSRFPYFVNAYGVHFLHGRAAAFGSGVSLARPDLHVFVFGGDGDAYSIGGNHLDHAARKNVKMTYVIMDNFVYGLTKKQTSPTSPLGFKSKTDPLGALDQPVNPMKKLIANGATFVARTHSHLPNHVMEMMEKAMAHDGFSVIECLSECTEFYPGAFDAANPRKGGVFNLVPADHDATDELAAYKLAMAPFPGYFGVFYQNQRPTKNALEGKLIADSKAKAGNATPVELLQKTFARLS
jgi:2-oxoglutarate ferredoxin oxidoreductase subunit beta